MVFQFPEYLNRLASIPSFLSWVSVFLIRYCCELGKRRAFTCERILGAVTLIIRQLFGCHFQAKVRLLDI